MSQKSSSWKSNLLLVICSFLTIGMLLELGIRTVDAVKGKGFFSEKRNALKKGIKPVRAFRTFGFDLYQDVDGVPHISSRYQELYPLKKPPQTFRIVVFGGSTSENLPTFKETGIHYPLLLQSGLQERNNEKNVEVINVANSGYSSAHSLIVFELDVLSWDPDLIIVSHNINDLTAAYWPNFTFDYSNKYSTKFYAIPDYASIYTVPNAIFQHSQMYWFIRKRLIRFLGDKPHPLQRASYGNAPPALAAQVFERNLRSIITLAKSHKIQVLLGGQPLQPTQEFFERSAQYEDYNSIIVYPHHEEFLEHHHAFNNIMQAVARDAQVSFVDNDSALDGKQEYFIDFVHYTPKGVAALANNYLRFIVNEKLIE